jgi:MerR-like DNA binding protein
MRFVHATFTRLTDFDLDDPVSVDAVADAVGARPALVAALVRSGLLETVGDETGEPLLPQRAVLRLRRMQRLRRDLGVNFAGADIILDLVERIEEMDRELAELRRWAGDHT